MLNIFNFSELVFFFLFVFNSWKFAFVFNSKYYMAMMVRQIIYCFPLSPLLSKCPLCVRFFKPSLIIMYPRSFPLSFSLYIYKSGIFFSFFHKISLLIARFTNGILNIFQWFKVILLFLILQCLHFNFCLMVFLLWLDFFLKAFI